MYPIPKVISMKKGIAARFLILELRFKGKTLVTGNVWGKSCTGGITLTNVLDLSLLNNKT